MRKYLPGIFIVAPLLIACNQAAVMAPNLTPALGSPTVTAASIAALDLTSPAFVNGEDFPIKYTCDGEDISPPLKWSDPPPGTRSFALILINPDSVSVVGRAWIQWILYNIPAHSRGLLEAVPPDAELADGSKQGLNSEEWLRYVGPCPPFRQRYYFRLYALDTLLDLEAGATREKLTESMEGHILAKGELMGRYKRK